MINDPVVRQQSDTSRTTANVQEMRGRIPFLLGWFISLPAALLGLLILLPAPAVTFWMLAVVATEWSAWIAAAGVAGLAAETLAAFRGQFPRALVPATFSVMSICCAAAPIVQAFNLAASEGFSLSWSRYLFGSDNADEITVSNGVTYATIDGKQLALDLYAPTDSVFRRTALPVVVVIHGGSWSGGARSDFASFDRWLASTGRIVADVDYRLADSNHRFPVPIADVKCAIAWIRDNAEQLGIDPRRIALLGRSAGGQLALLAAFTHNDHTVPTSCVGAPGGIRAVVSFYGPIDLAWGYHHPRQPDIINSRAVLENYLGGSPEQQPAEYTLASPIAHVRTDAPPTLLIHGGRDQLVSSVHVDRFVPKLRGAGVQFDYLYLPWADHGFDYNFNGFGSQIAQQRIVQFLDKHL